MLTHGYQAQQAHFDFSDLEKLYKNEVIGWVFLLILLKLRSISLTFSPKFITLVPFSYICLGSNSF